MCARPMMGAMFAVAFEAHVPEHDHLVVPVGLLEGALEDGIRLLVVAAEKFAIRTHHAIGRAEQPLAGRVVARPANEGPDRFFGFLLTRPLDARRRLRCAR